MGGLTGRSFPWSGHAASIWAYAEVFCCFSLSHASPITSSTLSLLHKVPVVVLLLFGRFSRKNSCAFHATCFFQSCFIFQISRLLLTHIALPISPKHWNSRCFVVFKNVFCWSAALCFFTNVCCFRHLLFKEQPDPARLRISFFINCCLLSQLNRKFCHDRLQLWYSLTHRAQI